MDFTTANAPNATDLCILEDVSDRKRFETFKLGASAPSGLNHHARRSSHSRSHSRNASVSPPMLSISTHSSLPPLLSPSLSSPPASPPAVPAGNAKRNSHHRRRSSVSTRHESAEIMGLSLHNVPATSSDDNINLGDKDSIRRRALLTLEGKTDVGSFARVEIPELTTPDTERPRFDFPTKPSFPPGIGSGYGGGIGSLGGSKRDSFGKFMASTSSKEQLGTLMEEEEEDEDEHLHDVSSPVEDETVTVSSAVEVNVTEPSAAPAPRHRPTNLNLRPLSLTSTLAQPTVDLPTPSPSPSGRPRPGLRVLTLSPSLSSESSEPSAVDAKVATNARKRQSLMITPSTSSTSSTSSWSFNRRASINGGVPSKRNSIPYVSSNDQSSFPNTGLPTPDMTPTSERRYSISSDVSSGSSRSSRSLSTSENSFLYQAHTALVQRISDLERALSARPRSRPQSCASEASVPAEAPSDEMLQLVTDLKTERDELKKDVDGWRTRVGDCENQVTMLLKRVEVERREAWVARERANLMEVEKNSLQTKLAEKTSWGEEGWRKCAETQTEMSKVLAECQRLRDRTQRCSELEAECLKMAAALAEERKRREDAERELDSLLTTPTPQAADSKYRTPPISRTMIFAKRSGLGFRSIDSTGSFTDVESLPDSEEAHQLTLKSVEEEDEYDDGSFLSDPEDELASYEDEDDGDDYGFQASISNLSFESDDEPRETSHLVKSSDEYLVPELTNSRSASSSPAPQSPSPEAHRRHHSLVKAWTFPHTVEPAPKAARAVEEIDRFFGCLEDVDNSPPLDARLHSIESGKNLFAQALADDDDDLPPFVIPAAVGIEVPTSESRSFLDVVVEEDEEQDDSVDFSDEIVGEEVEGGIIFTFSPPPGFCGPEDDEHVEAAPSVPEAVQAVPEPSIEPVLTSPKSETISPSSIPRPASKSFISSIPTPSSSTPKRASVAFPRSASASPTAYSTPTRPSVSRASSIPQPSSTPRKSPAASFIPQPRRAATAVAGSSLKSPAVSTPTKIQSKPRSSIPPHSTSQMNADHPYQTSSPSPADVAATSTSPVISPTLAALQTWTSFIAMPSMPWSSPKLGFSSLANYSPSPADAGSPSAMTPEIAVASPTPTTPKGTRFVSKESQLEKLRLRLERERLNPQDPPVFVARQYQHGILHI